MIVRLAQWNRGAGLPSSAPDWLARAAGIGKLIRVRSGDGELSGQFKSLDETGRLVLRLADGTRQTVTAGDVFMAARQ